MMAYKPAVADFDRMLVRSPVALRFQWTDRNRLDSGGSLREVLGKAVAYAKKWDEYEKKLAAWTPPKEEPKAEEAKKAKVEGEKGSTAGSKAESKKDESETKAKDEKAGEKAGEKASEKPADKKEEKKSDKKDDKKKKKGKGDPEADHGRLGDERGDPP
jgi:hypothetical protein